MKELLQQVKDLKSEYKYKEARDFIDENTTDANLLRILAECYYKDLELHRDFSYDKALRILGKIDDTSDNDKKETLCLKGAVYKRKWEYQAKLDDLYEAIKNYEEAYTEHKDNDRGYGAINAAYLYDVLANTLGNVGFKNYQEFEEKATKIRQDIINAFNNSKSDRWIYHTLAQAYLGISDLSTCKEILQESLNKNYNYSDWETYTTFKQMRELAKLKKIENLDVLLPLVGEDNRHLLETTLDKKGLALSGGGFRASFFHLGTLAKLAECDLLKDIEVISTVSGGSIIGVHYYLKLQKMLEEKSDIEITQADYIELVHELIEEFFEAVQTDIRNSVITKNFFSNTVVKILNPFSSYSRTNKLGQLYQERIYKKYKQYMHELIITPHGWEDGKFKPRFHNWRRKNKVPILVINATNLNSGHNWQFQATKMGEPDYMYNMEIDKNNRFDWVRYTDKGLQEKFKNYSIGQAVACSSAVPMLFTPVVLEDLYEGYKLSISDGGVYDNQGFSGLLSEECDYIICSDASGQMDNQITSHTSILRTNMRTIDIQMDRNREMIFEDMQNKKERGILKGFLFTHLKQNLQAYEINQADAIQKFEDNQDKEFQELISDVRTDLDKFSKTEAYALMYNGYELFQGQTKSMKDCHKKDDWVFLSIKNDVDKKSEKLMDELELSEHQFTRRFRKWWKSR
ncbi:MAG: patatin-like phospholipase family protein [Sulfurimonas sp.]|nr:patatin-like phospholipase family protein [Sulfurimonas sp.]MDD3060278.1 patatin-like phospholipase family protein [Sulfurimonas sp.]MDD5201827.1 patatin-like phospholipase family protein [Sulfurimonas sp.]